MIPNALTSSLSTRSRDARALQLQICNVSLINTGSARACELAQADSWRTEFNAPLTAAIQKHLLKSGTTAGKIAIRSGVTAPLGDWKDWETPTLQ